MENTSVEGLVKVIVYGVPALLIFLGFIAYISGYTLGMFTGSDEMKNLGIFMIGTGIVLYIIELGYAIYRDYTS